MDKKRCRQWIAGTLLVGWLSATCVGYGWYQVQVNRPYQGSPETHARLPEDQVRARLENLMAQQPHGSGPVLVHFSRPDCRCDKDSRAHLQTLVSQYPDTSVIRLPPPDSKDASGGVVKRIWAMVPAVPSAAVFSREGRLTYFGPYSSGPVCGSGIEFVGQTLQALAQEPAPELWVNDLAFGCFCSSGTYNLTAQT